MSALHVVALVLSAGSSTRLGTSKALLKFAGKSMVRRAAECCLQSKAKATVVVTGHQADAVRGELKELPVRVVVNDNYRSGRTGSIKCGLKSVWERSKSWDFAAVIFPVDCPFVPPSIIDGLIDCLHVEVGLGRRNLWISPEHGGKGGHPALLYGPIIEQIMDAVDDFSLRDFLNRQACAGRLSKIRVIVESPAVIDNLDDKIAVSESLARESESLAAEDGDNSDALVEQTRSRCRVGAGTDILMS